ncbi:DNA helicase HerA, contains HAS-barrel and ATPase domains [Thermomonospora echinospora]|uniref:DNA helicase HerA, contains HAS-barrel and ATPase domains n=1 Tax=Thermomonospora echinospora TaxID=1992 RepID=A0A1H6DKQ6_9ACTN|nr:ATP-binding protein [Thermomonospora echinospora]SEG86007.1 DNA helicase HerA, contains HAS-barrel and ATPase domains [Thermomonospora echinospora]
MSFPPESVPGGGLPGPWYRILAVPAVERAPSAEWDFVTVLPAVLSARQQRRAFVVGWLSRGGGAPLELISNAGPVSPGHEGLLFPNGARGVPVGEEWLRQAGRMVWTRCPGRPAPPVSRTETVSGPSLFESTLVTLMDRPFGWFVVAEPADERLIDVEIRELQHELRMLRRGEDEQARLDVARAERRLAELDAFHQAGLWQVRVLAGAASLEELARVAPVLVGSMELTHHPYRLRAGYGSGSFAEVLQPVAPSPVAPHPRQSPHTRPAADAEPRFPFAATAGALAALAGLPRREVPGLRVLEAGYFDVTLETDGEHQGAEPPIELGAILDGQDRRVGTFTVPRSTVNRHVFVTGATGAGKSQTVRHLLEQLTRAGVPWLAIEPAKSEYAAMAGRIRDLGGRVTVINPSDLRSVPLSVNPLAPEPGYPVQAHIDMVRALFQAAFDAEEPFPQIMSQALQRVYEANGWDVVTGAGMPGSLVEPAVPTLEQLQRAALDVIGEVGYGRELMADVKGFVDVRLRSLRIGSAGRFFEGGHPADVGGMLRENIVLAIEDVANDEDKAFLMGTLIIRIVEHLRMRARERGSAGGQAGLRHVIVIEEAHRLLRNRGPERTSSHAVELFAGMLAEIRAYGEGIIVAEQIPTKLVPDVIKNTALKVVHRLPAFDDRHQVGAAMNLDDDQSREVVSLRPGAAAVFADGMDRPLRVRIPYGEGREAVLPGPPPPIDGRRSAACGCECRSGRACNLYELREADLLAGHVDSAWLRVWTDTLVLAHVVGRPLPVVPPELGSAWSRLTSRLRECALATVVERCVTRRAWALRSAYAPDKLTTAVAATAQRLLGGEYALAGTSPGPNWVIGQVKWLHEMERIFPYGAPTPDKHTPAPPLEYQLPGLRQAPEARAGHRLRALRRHPLSMELPANRPIALTALVGEDDHEGFADDLAVVAVGLDPDEQLTEIARAMRVTSWLEPVLSWPDRFVLPSQDSDGAPPFLALPAQDPDDAPPFLTEN